MTSGCKPRLTMGWTGAAQASVLWFRQYRVRGPVIPTVSRLVEIS